MTQAIRVVQGQHYYKQIRETERSTAGQCSLMKFLESVVLFFLWGVGGGLHLFCVLVQSLA